MDKRRSPRYAIKLGALVHPNEGRSWLCHIQDFCNGGMLLTEKEGGRARKPLPGINPGEIVGIHFSVPTKTKDKHFRLEGKIIRAMETGVGINFSAGMDPDAMDALLNYSNSLPAQVKEAERTAERKVTGSGKKAGEKVAATGAKTAKAGGSGYTPPGSSAIKPQDSKKIVAAIRREVSRVLPEMNSAFFSYMDEELLKLARDAKTNAEQSDYFAAMSTLEKAKKSVGQSFTNEVLDQIDNPRDLNRLLEERKAAENERKQKEAKKVKLSLVNTDEFEDWLAVANIISRSERMYEKYLQEIRARLGMLVDSWGHVEANPLGTSVFCHAFDASIRKVEVTKEIRQKVYSGFESKVIPLFRKLYLSVTKLLEQSKLFPDLDEDYITPSASVGPKIVNEDPKAQTQAGKIEPVPEPEAQAEEEEANEPSLDLQSELNELRNELMKRQENQPSERQAPRPNKSSPPRNLSKRAPPGQGRTAQARTEPRDMGQAITNIYSTVRGLQHQHQEEQYEPGTDLVDFNEVQELLSALRPPAQGSARSWVRDQVVQSAGKPVAPEVLESLEVVENLVDTIESDNMLAPTAKDWIRQLEVTLDKVATREENFLSEENPHQSLEVINQLAKLGGAESGSVRRSVEGIVQKINENFDDDPGIFDEALQQLKPLVARQSKAFTGNVQRTVKASEGQQTLINAQQAVVSELSERLTGREVPEVLMKLLMPGWRNLLVNTHLRQGEDSADWKRHVQALDQVVQHIDGSADPNSTEGYMAPTELLEHIEQGLDSISFEPGQRAPLVNSLRQLLVEGGSKEGIKMVEVPPDSVAETLGFGDVDEREQKRRDIVARWEGNAEWERWLEKATRLHVGDWIEFAGEEQVSIVAWANEESTNFVFVNRRGVKTHDLLLEELAEKLAREEAKVMEESDLPLTDRASHRMLQNMHNQLTHQATHDELTGLVNRKEFERALEKLLAETKRKNTHHVVAYMDLDQFKVINNAAGHDAGDKLLASIGTLLVEQLGDSEFVVSRLGGDEFGVMIKNCNRDSGLSVIRQLSDAIKANQFQWGGDIFTLTTSCGVVFVDNEIESVTAILRGADASCYAAKDAGRDRINVFEANDSDLKNRRDIMEFVSQIDTALKEDRFILNCQKIAPIVANGVDHDHYEILLTVLDENNEPMPPQDFIVAAETYNRMGAIDRWVIKNAFRWIASNILKLDNLGAFSINISGNSLTEADFMEFVLEQFNETRLPTSKICFEITETSAIGSLDDAIEFMEKMKVIGVQFSLDDFGTGLSSYSYLRNLPVDYLKIDGIFVKDIKTNPNDYAVVKSINEIGHFMGKKTIAEYVEDDEILEILREIGVDYAQGYGIGRKMPINQLL